MAQWRTVPDRTVPREDGEGRATTDALPESRSAALDRETNNTRLGQPADRPVNSYTEWESLEEVIVGRLAGGVFPSWQDSMHATLPEEHWKLFQEKAGTPLPRELVYKAEKELENLARRLEHEGVTVVRPDPVDQQRSYSTPEWASAGGLYSAMPRDLLLVVGDIIIEAPMSWRCRYHEIDAYRSLIKDYFCRGTRWLPGPRPQLTDELFADAGDPRVRSGARYAITEFEPVFDAADFVRFGGDIVVQKSHVTNTLGVEWLRQAVGKDFQIHYIDVSDPHPMHIDATIVPLAPGKLLVNADRFIPNEIFEDWDIREAPKPTLPNDWPMYFSSPWLSMNVLSLDEETVIVESQEEPLQKMLTSWGFECIPVDFRNVYTFGGGFHCATLDVCRRGTLRRYLKR